MKKVFLAFVILIFGVGVYYVWSTRSVSKKTGQEEKDMGTLSVTSSAFQHNGTIPLKYTCDGEDISPPLSISGVSDETKSLVLIMDDPDAPVGTWDHWVVWNINPATKEITENSVPSGSVEGKTSSGQNQYGGPCPPSGTHWYFFKFYALDTLLDLSVTSGKKDVEKAMEGRILDKTEIIGLYKR